MLNYQRRRHERTPQNLTRADVDMSVLVPAYMLSELKVGFLMGFRVYLPFLVIDMVIASILLISMSMMMLPPVMISLPFKLHAVRAGGRVDAGDRLVCSRVSSWTAGRDASAHAAALLLMRANRDQAPTPGRPGP